MSNSPSELGLTSLHDIVVNYVSTAAYSSTARILSSQAHKGPHPTSHIDGHADADGAGVAQDADGDETMDGDDAPALGSTDKGKRRRKRGAQLDEDDLQAIERRRAILNHILNGAIIRAVESLNAHFPAVLADPPLSSSTSTTPTNGTNGTNGYAGGHGDGQQIQLQLQDYGLGNRFGPSYGYSYPATTSTATSSIYNYSSAKPFSSTSASTPAAASASGSAYNHSTPVLFRSTYPSHVRLNLQIQQFIESFRQLSPSSPSTLSSPSSSMGSLTNSGTLSNSTATLTHALTAAQGLHAEAKKLPAEIRAVYLQEIKDVGALFAYADPENSILGGFLDQNRRIRLADQVNAAILRSQGKPTQSTLEAFVRRTTLEYNLLNEHGLDPRPAWTAADGSERAQLAEFFKNHSGRPFELREYINQTW